jgi:hypothetical protein
VLICLGNLLHCVINSKNIIHILDMLWVKLKAIFESFNTVSFFTKGPIREVMNLLG